MVVDDVEDDGDAERVGAIDEAAEIVGPAVEPGRREQVDAIISPAEPAREIRHGHHFDAGDAELGERRQLARSRLPASLRGEGADMHLVDDQLARARRPRHAASLQAKRPGIDDFRRPVRPLRLKARGRVGQRRLVPIEAEPIAHAGPRRQAPAARNSRRRSASQCRRFEAFDLDRDLPTARRPDAEMDAAVGLRLGADRQAPDGPGCGRDQMFPSCAFEPCRRRLSLPGEHEAGVCVHVVTSLSPMGRNRLLAVYWRCL